MDASSSLDCDLRIIRAKNLEAITAGNIFVRYYLCTADKRKIQLKSKEISSRSNLYWNESACLQFIGADEDALNQLEQESVVFELRWRKTSLSRSKLLLKVETGWKDVLESAEMSIEKWITSATTTKYVMKDMKPPALEIGMKVRVPMELKRTHVRSPAKWNECGCRHGACNGREEDIFALAATMVVNK